MTCSEQTMAAFVGFGGQRSAAECHVVANAKARRPLREKMLERGCRIDNRVHANLDIGRYLPLVPIIR
jgi:hypothetical protein